MSTVRSSSFCTINLVLEDRFSHEWLVQYYQNNQKEGHILLLHKYLYHTILSGIYELRKKVY